MFKLILNFFVLYHFNIKQSKMLKPQLITDTNVKGDTKVVALRTTIIDKQGHVL